MLEYVMQIAVFKFTIMHLQSESSYIARHFAFISLKCSIPSKWSKKEEQDNKLDKSDSEMLTAFENCSHLSDYNCYKIFGFDIMMDEGLEPWLLEVNSFPSMFPHEKDL